MANFLELVRQLAEVDGSIDRAAITSVVDQVGRPGKMVNFVNRAYTNIQNSRRDWGWLTEDFEATLIPGTAIYTPASFNLTRFSNFIRDDDDNGYMPLSLRDDSIGLSDEHEVEQITYQHWRTLYGRGDQSSDYWNRPVTWSVTPKRELAFGPYPDAAYVIRSQYQKGPQTLAANSDIPEMPTRFHDLIVWEAHRLLLIHDGAFADSQFPTMEMATLRQELECDQLPEVKVE